MARMEKTVKIDLGNGEFKDFTIKELTIHEIIDLSQGNSFFIGKVDTPPKESQNGEVIKNEENEPGFFEELKEYSKQIQGVMDKVCDFTLTDLKPLAPSDVKELYDSFKEVNQTFLDVLEKLKILEMLNQVLVRHTKIFSKMLVI